MFILGISSAAKIVSIGLVNEEKVLAETTIRAIQSEKIIHYINEAGIRPDQINGIAVAAGPGSYSGLRGGLATAKTLAQTLNLPLIGISTLEAIAYNLVDIEGTMAVVLDARADEYNFALFGASQGRLKRLTDDLVLKLGLIKERLLEISGKLWVVGEGNRDWEVGKRENIHIADNIHSLPYGVNVAKLGLLKMQTGQTDDIFNLNPQYSHKPNIREFVDPLSRTAAMEFTNML
ncbi:MAG: tRNA (adenosine(37)-N6)-threonylcarbamoyltransferase complex dimerization subunit type 1 TsaB [Candidatus Margulisbacteria bacterium]|nr:tRNA (adenosine(37)-N6)-threonylcarbamoyltransferase complex dimerization subunit type 1 TsaB [Candidatus Margulisiibacteriota bacterium]